MRCEEASLDQLLFDLNVIIWPEDMDGARVFYERLPVGSGVSGGMGGGIVIDGVWVHDEFQVLNIAGNRTIEHDG